MTTAVQRRPDISQDILVLKAFREHLRVLSVPTLLDLLLLASTAPISNEDVRRVLRLNTRMSGWRWLSRLGKLNMLEKRGNAYRISDYAGELIAAEALAFRGIARDGVPENVRQAPQEILAIAETGVKVMYDRGMLTQDEYNGKLKLIQDFRDATA